jgi:hypothetical protein
MEADERTRYGSSFGAAAAAYAEHRPDYAEARRLVTGVLRTAVG